MARKNKLRRFQELGTFSNVYQMVRDNPSVLRGVEGIGKLKGQWAKKHFGNDNSITLELACGKGEYTTGLATKYPDRNFIGVDIKGARLWKGAKRAQLENLSNAAFLRIRIEHIANYFAPDEISEIWITFPDPFLKKENRRLTSPNFIKEYKKICPGGSPIHLKTDDAELYDYTSKVIEMDESLKLGIQNEDAINCNLFLPDLEIKTYYELMHIKMNKKIKYISFSI